MAAKAKVTVTVETGLLRELERASRTSGKPRSRLVEEALRLWQRHQLEAALREGYRAMAKEDLAMAERHLRAAWPALK